MRCFIECAPFSDVNTNAFEFEVLPGRNALMAQGFFVALDLVSAFEGPRRLGPGVGAMNPARLIMADLHWLIAARPLSDGYIGKCRNRRGSPAQAVGDDEPLRVFGADGLNEAADYPRIGFFGNIRRFI